MTDRPEEATKRRLTNEEVIALAYRVSEKQMASEWLEREDIPEVGEYDFARIVEKVDTVRNYLKEARTLMERTWGVTQRLCWRI